MKRTYINRLPKNEEVKNTNVRIENGELIVEVDFKDKFEPKDGDFVITDEDGIYIYNSNYKTEHCGLNGFYVGLSRANGISIGNGGKGFLKAVRYATPEEKADFLERLEKERHKIWNAEKKCLEDIRWRAKNGYQYWFVSTISADISIKLEGNVSFDDERYNSGNYFKTKEAAQKVADQIKEIFKNSKAE